MIKQTFVLTNKEVTGKVDVEFSDTNEDFSFKVTGPINILSKICGGLGKEDYSKDTVVITEKELKTESQRLYLITELAQLASK